MRGNEFAELQAVLAVAEQGSFVRAAQALRVFPSALSQKIKGLEAVCLNRVQYSRPSLPANWLESAVSSRKAYHLAP